MQIDNLHEVSDPTFKENHEKKSLICRLLNLPNSVGNVNIKVNIHTDRTPHNIVST